MGWNRVTGRGGRGEVEGQSDGEGREGREGRGWGDGVTMTRGMGEGGGTE